MNPKVKEVGGSAALSGLSEDFINALHSVIGGNFGGQPTAGQRFDAANPVGSTDNFLGGLTDVLSPGGGGAGSALRTSIATKQAEDVADLRARFGASGGQAFGTPAAYAEAGYRAKAAPEAAIQTSQLQLQALLPFLNILTQLSGRGISPRTTSIQPSDFTQIASGLGGLAEGAGSLVKGIKA